MTLRYTKRAARQIDKALAIHRPGERIGRAIGEIEPRLWIDALAVAVKSIGSGARLKFVKRTISIWLSASNRQSAATAALP